MDRPALPSRCPVCDGPLDAGDGGITVEVSCRRCRVLILDIGQAGSPDSIARLTSALQSMFPTRH